MKKKKGMILVYVLILTGLVSIALIYISKSTKINLQLAKNQQVENKLLNYAETKASELLNQVENDPTFTQGPTTEVLTDGTKIKSWVERPADFEATIENGRSIEFPVQTTTTSTVTFMWWDKDIDCTTDNPTSLVVTVIKQVGTDEYIAQRYAYGPCNASRGDNFIEPDSADPNSGYKYKININVDSDTRIIRITPVYNDTNLLAQGPLDQILTVIYAEASSPTDENATKAVKLTRIKGGAPSVLDYTLVGPNISVD